MNRKNKTFDAAKMMREIRNAHYEETKEHDDGGADLVPPEEGGEATPRVGRAKRKGAGMKRGLQRYNSQLCIIRRGCRV